MAHGDGIITEKGYRRIMRDGRYVMEHVAVWEAEHGRPVPPDHDIHHRDDDKLNNHPSNLQLVTKLQHKRIHGGCWQREDGVWMKPCRGGCGETKPITAEHWYFNRQGQPMYGRCKPCRIKQVVEAKRSRAAAART